MKRSETDRPAETAERAGIDERIQDTVRRLAETEAKLEALIAGEADAVVDPEAGRLFLLRDAQAALQESQSRYHRLVTRVSALVFELAPDGTVLFVNEAAAAITGHTPQELTGRNAWEVWCPGELRAQAEVLQARLQREDVSDYELLVATKDGQRRLLDMTSANRYRDDGALQTVLGFAIDRTERRLAEKELGERERALTEAQRIARLGNWIWDLHDDSVTWSVEACRILGIRAVETVPDYRAFLGLVHSEDRAEVDAALRAAIDHHAPYDRVHRVVHPDGTERVVHGRGEVAYDPAGKAVRVMGTLQDVTERERAAASLRQAATVFQSTSEGIIVTDPAHNILTVNRAFAAITGYGAQEVLGRQPRLLTSERHPDDFYRQIGASLDQTGNWQGEIWNRRKNGEVYPAWLTISAVQDETGGVRNYVYVFSDISPIKEAEERLRHLAHHDALTELPNRLLFMARLEHALQRARRNGQQVAVLFLDLDRFKTINDTLGHEWGDMLLQVVAERLRACVRAQDTVARLGGDEFTVILDDLTRAEDAALLAGKIIDIVAAPITLRDREVVTSTSIGISLYPHDAKTSADLVKAADAAMYLAKQRGRSNYQFYTAELTEKAMAHFALESDLRQALAQEQFLLYYQPQVALSTGRIVGVEGLLRWQHPRRGLVLPEDFIPLAEETGLIDKIGEWALRTACAQARAWREAGIHLRIAVNVSGTLAVRPNGFERLAAMLEELVTEGDGCLPLEIEITESVLQTPEASVEKLRALRPRGVRIAVDDFGTGYSSLSKLKQLPVDTLKIDQSFIHDIPYNSDDEAIVRAIVALGHNLRMNVIAEGVETPAQLGFLKALGCDEAQGFHFSEPLPAEQVAPLLAEGRAPVG